MQEHESCRRIVTSLVTGFTGLAYLGISSNFCSKRQKALQKAFGTMEKSVDSARNLIFHFENIFYDYVGTIGIYQNKELYIMLLKILYTLIP